MKWNLLQEKASNMKLLWTHLNEHVSHTLWGANVGYIIYYNIQQNIIQQKCKVKRYDNDTA